MSVSQYAILSVSRLVSMLVSQYYITIKLTSPNHDQRHKYHHLTTTLHLTLKMTTAQVVETSVTNYNSLSKDYPHPDVHTKLIPLDSNHLPSQSVVSQ